MNTDAQKTVGLTETQIVQIPLPPDGLRLESGAVLPELRVAYETYGQLTPAKDNAVFVCHALSGDAHVAGYHDLNDPTTVGWWEQMIGPGKGIDTDHYFVICANILGGCRGTTGPSSVDPRTGAPYGSQFPQITVGDIVRVHCLLLEKLEMDRLAAVIGGSFGGMQVLEWAIAYPEMIETGICIASAVSLSAQALAFDVVGRKAITYDPHWCAGDYYGKEQRPERGLSLARKIGHITYLSKDMMARKFGRARGGAASEETFHSDFQIESYLEHQGRKFVSRFDANSYLHITRAMDEFDLLERFGSLEEAVKTIQAKMLIVALEQDWLFPCEQSQEIANALLHAGKHVSYCELDAPQGHDGFLVNIEHLAEVMRAFLPWVGAARRERSEDMPTGNRFRPREEYVAIVNMIQRGSSVLDLGCGDGQLLSLLGRQRDVSGIGVDIDLGNVINVIDRGHDVFLKNIDGGLSIIPDDTYDYAILSETLQEVHKPRLVLEEMLRVAREGIVSFPNFGKWSHRFYLWGAGRMPKGGALPFEWFDTPNIHLFTLYDFVDLCHQDGITILDVVCMPNGPLSRLLLRLGCCNLGADRVLIRVTKHHEGDDISRARTKLKCRVCRRCGLLHTAAVEEKENHGLGQVG